jgi:hypothetical protein
MGEFAIRKPADEAESRVFTRAVPDDVRALEALVARDGIETGVMRMGAEHILARVDDPRFTAELARFNLEASFDPHRLRGDFLATLERELRGALARVSTVAADACADVGRWVPTWPPRSPSPATCSTRIRTPACTPSIAPARRSGPTSSATRDLASMVGAGAGGRRSSPIPGLVPIRAGRRRRQRLLRHQRGYPSAGPDGRDGALGAAGRTRDGRSRGSRGPRRGGELEPQRVRDRACHR